MALVRNQGNVCLKIGFGVHDPCGTGHDVGAPGDRKWERLRKLLRRFGR